MNSESPRTGENKNWRGIERKEAKVEDVEKTVDAEIGNGETAIMDGMGIAAEDGTERPKSPTQREK